MSFDINKLMLADKFGVTFEPDEYIKLICTPHLKACSLNQVIYMILLLLLLAVSMAFFRLGAYLAESNFQWKMLSLFHGIFFLLALGNSILDILKLRTTTYLITNISIVIRREFYTSSTQTINIKDIKTYELEKTFVDKHFKTGTIKIFTGKTKDNDGTTEKVYDYLVSIIEPEKAFALLYT